MMNTSPCMDGTTKDWYTCAETAQLLRRALKEAFPGVTFSVVSKTYSGGASIRVRWTGGPTRDAVNAIARRFEGATFDGMIDLKEYHASTYQGRKVQWGADFIFCERQDTPEASFHI